MISIRFSAKVAAMATAAALLAHFVIGCGIGDGGGGGGGQVQGPTTTTPGVALELPPEVETELGPAGSLKQAPLWKEIVQLLEDPYAMTCWMADTKSGQDCATTIDRRPGFGVTMPDLGVYPLDFNTLTGQPMRLRTSDGEISWDEPGPMFAPGDYVDPTTRPIIGYLEVDVLNNLIVNNTTGDPSIPPTGTIVAVPAYVGGQLLDIDGNPILEFETPINEIDFLRPETDTLGVAVALQPYIGRWAAEILGKALFWDMQVGSDGIQACGTCHFQAGIDTRTRNQLNPNHLGGDLTLQVAGPNAEVVASDFPFHKLFDPDIPGEPMLNPGNVLSDANDIMSSMGVIFRVFDDIPPIGQFIDVDGVDVLPPDIPVIGAPNTDPIPVFQGLRRVEPRNTPTFHSPAFNFDNFWDGRARFHFNGGSVAGPSDPTAHIFIDPGDPGLADGDMQGATNGHIRSDLIAEDPEAAAQPVRIRFSSLASQAVGPPLSNFEMSFDGRNWAKIGKKMLQDGVTPLANQLVATDDSRLGVFSNQGGALCIALLRPTALGMPGLCTTYNELIELAFAREFWHNGLSHLDGAPGPDPFDGYVLTLAPSPADPVNTNQFTQMEANFSLLFGLSVQTYEQLTIPDDTPFDQFMDVNPRAGYGVGQPGEQGTLPPDQVAALVGPITLVTGFGEDELFGFDIFAGANLTAALANGSARNPAPYVGSNPFLRTARCMLCHLGPEQTDHTISVDHGLLLSDTELELPPPGVAEPTGPFRFVTGLMLEEELEGAAQDGVEVENRDFSVVFDPVRMATVFYESYPGAGNEAAVEALAAEIGLPTHSAFGDNGIYNIGVRPTDEDIGRGGDDEFGWPLSLSALAMKNLAGQAYEPCDDLTDSNCAFLNYDPALGPGGGLFEETGDDAPYPMTTHTLQSINPGLEMDPINPLMPDYMVPWLNNLPAGELHPQIDELAFAPNHITHPPFAEFGEILFGSDLNCIFVAVNPNNPTPAEIAANDWGPRCPNIQSAVPNNFDPPLNGTWPFPNRVGRMGAFKAPQLRNVELTGPYFHTGSYLTLRQIIDFYMRGGDFPMTNADHRDPNLVDIEIQAFGFGSTNILVPINVDGVPDAFGLYDAMPDTDHPTSPEYATPEDAKVSLVKFLLSLTDERVRFERAPFDRPEIFVPVDGTAPDNTGGRNDLLVDPRFLHVPEVGAGGNGSPLPNFLGISSVPVAGPNNDHFDQ